MVSSPSGPPTESTPPRHTRPSFTQVAASALAAVSAAVISSTFGVAGTLIGAAIASICASVGSTLYLASLRSTNERLRRMATAARRTDWSSAIPGRPAAAPTRLMDEPPTVLLEAIEAERPTGWDRLRWSNLRRGLPTLRKRWLAVAGLAVVVFAIAIGVLTAVQASTNQQLSIGGGGSGHAPSKAPATSVPSSTPPSAHPTVTPTPGASSPAPGASPTASPSAGASSPAPSEGPSASPSAGATLPTPASPSPAAATAP